MGNGQWAMGCHRNGDCDCDREQREAGSGKRKAGSKAISNGAG